MDGKNRTGEESGLGMDGIIRAAMLAAAVFYGVFLLRALQLAGAADREG